MVEVEPVFEVAVVQVEPLVEYFTMYPETDAPPLTGAVQESGTWPLLPAVPVKLVGASGVVNGVTGPYGAENVPRSAVVWLIAATWK